MSTVKMVDKNSVRGGAAVSVVVLLVGYLFDARWVVPIVGVALGVGAFFGLPRSPLGAIYRAGKKALNLKIPVEPEEASPPRFAQTLGFAFLAASTIGFYLLDSSVTGWALALMVAGLQALLAATGICVGCELYLLGKRLAAKGA